MSKQVFYECKINLKFGHQALKLLCEMDVSCRSGSETAIKRQALRDKILREITFRHSLAMNPFMSIYDQLPCFCATSPAYAMPF